jgi:hypothetical protein
LYLSRHYSLEKYSRVTPYNYAGNNPLVLSDPTGFGWFTDALKGAKDIAQGAFDGVASDITGENIHTGDRHSSLYTGAKIGAHVADTYLGVQGIVVGAGMTGGGVAGAIPSGGTSLVISGEGILVMGVSARFTGNAIGNLVNEVSMMSQGNGDGEKHESTKHDLPEKDKEGWTKLKGDQGWRDKDGNIWKKDMKHKDHWDISDKKGKKIREVDFDGNQIWPEGPKNKNKR